jgi:hypothetical protein
MSCDERKSQGPAAHTVVQRRKAQRSADTKGRLQGSAAHTVVQRRKAQQTGDVSGCVPSSDDVKLIDYDDLAPAGMEACCPQARLY